MKRAYRFLGVYLLTFGVLRLMGLDLNTSAVLAIAGPGLYNIGDKK